MPNGGAWWMSTDGRCEVMINCAQSTGFRVIFLFTPWVLVVEFYYPRWKQGKAIGNGSGLVLDARLLAQWMEGKIRRLLKHRPTLILACKCTKIRTGIFKGSIDDVVCTFGATYEGRGRCSGAVRVTCMKPYRMVGHLPDAGSMHRFDAQCPWCMISCS